MAFQLKTKKGFSATMATDPVTPDAANKFAVQLFAGTYPYTPVQGAGWTPLIIDYMGYQQLSSATPISSSGTVPVNFNWAAMLALFDPVGPGAPFVRLTSGIASGSVSAGTRSQTIGAVVAGDLVCVPVIVNASSSSALPSVTDDQGNAYLPFASIGDGDGEIFLFIGTASISASSLTVTFTNANDLHNSSVMVFVLAGLVPPSASVSFTVSPSTIVLGESATLSWSVLASLSQSIDMGIGAVAASGSTVVTPTETTYYNLTVLTTGAPIVAFVELDVMEPEGTGLPPFANGTDGILFWQGTTPKVLNLTTLKVTSPTVRGTPVSSSKRWSYALGKLGFIYMHNGTDKKFFDSVVFRDIGLPQLADAEVANSVVSPGLAAITPTQAAAVTHSFTGVDGVAWDNIYERDVSLAFFDLDTNQLMPGANSIATIAPRAGAGGGHLALSGLPVSPSANIVKLLGVTWGGGSRGVPVGANSRAFPNGTTIFPLAGAFSAPDSSTVKVMVTAHGLSTNDVILLGVTPNGRVGPHLPPFDSAGPFAVTVIDADHFTFTVPAGQAPLYMGGVAGGTWDITFIGVLQQIASATTTASIIEPALFTLPYLNMWPDFNGGSIGFVQSGIPASSIGGAQPGYQFYGSIYNRLGGQHIGNRIPLGVRFNNTALSNAQLTLLPDLSAFDSEWELLIGRTGDGGDIPYAVMDSGGNWVSVPNGQTSITITQSQIDGNAELPFENNVPPLFSTFWREGDRMGGAIPNQPFVYRSGSELDAQSGIFMGDPAQAWPARLVETFPTAAAIVGGFGYMQESWVFTANDGGQLSELSGETAWNGPYNVSVAGPFAFAQGWSSLPFWVSHDKQLCTMLPNSNGPIPISGEYEAALLAKIGDAYIRSTEVVYFRDSLRQIEALRIKCFDSNGIPFTVIHDFNLRDARSPYGQGYSEIFLGPLATSYTQFYLRDGQGHGRVWAGASDGNFYQLYLGGDDSGTNFTADALTLQYIGPENTAVKTLDWYGDQNVQWFIADNLDTVADPNQMTNLTDQVRPVPGQEHNSHFMADLQSPEMTHVYLWMRLVSHPADAADQAHPTALNDPPHMPLETYGRVLQITPVLGDSRGR